MYDSGSCQIQVFQLLNPFRKVDHSESSRKTAYTRAGVSSSRGESAARNDARDENARARPAQASRVQSLSLLALEGVES